MKLMDIEIFNSHWKVYNVKIKKNCMLICGIFDTLFFFLFLFHNIRFF